MSSTPEHGHSWLSMGAIAGAIAAGWMVLVSIIWASTDSGPADLHDRIEALETQVAQLEETR